MPTFKGRNAFTVWLEKTDALEPEDSERKWITAGNRLEPVILDYAEEQYGELQRNVVVFDKQCEVVASTLDGYLVNDNVPVEAKTSGIDGPIHGDWGDAGSDHVPDGYLVQCQTQILCTGADVCRLMALLGGRGFVEFQIEREDDLTALIRNVSEDFWNRYVIPRKNPREDWADRLANTHGIALLGDPCAPVYDVVARLKRVEGKEAPIIDLDAVELWDAYREARLGAEKAEKEQKAIILADMGDAEIGVMPDGRSITFKTQKTADIIDRNAMKTDGVYDKYATSNTARVMRMKKAKK
jgi:putative phage-type endonuclease